MRYILIAILVATCAPSTPLARKPPACVIQGTLLRDTLIGADMDSLTIVTGLGGAGRLAHAIDPHAPVLQKGDQLYITCHEELVPVPGFTQKDTIVDSLTVLSHRLAFSGFACHIPLMQDSVVNCSDVGINGAGGLGGHLEPLPNFHENSCSGAMMTFCNFLDTK